MTQSTSVYTFSQIYDACASKGMRARLYMFDAGATIEVSEVLYGKQLCRLTAEWGDAVSAADLTAHWLMDNGLVSVLDFTGPPSARAISS